MWPRRPRPPAGEGQQIATPTAASTSPAVPENPRISRGGEFYTRAQLEAHERVEDAAVAWENSRDLDGWPPPVTRFGVETEEVSWC